MKVHSHDHTLSGCFGLAQQPRYGRANTWLFVTVCTAAVLIMLLLRKENSRAAAEQQTDTEPSSGAKSIVVPTELAIHSRVGPLVEGDAGKPVVAGLGGMAVDTKLDMPDREDRANTRLDLKQWPDTVQRLHGGQDASTRLAAARGILADETPGPLKLRALDVLAELDPTAAAGELRELAAGAAEDPRRSALVMSALQSLGRREGVLSSPDLVAFFDRGSREVQIAAASALASRGDESLSLRFQEQRKGELAHADPEVRAAAVRDLAAIHGQTSLALIVPLLADESDEVRLAALSAVAQSDDPSALEGIRPLVDDSSELVRRMATRMVEMREKRLARERERESPLGPRAPRPGPGGQR